MPNTILIVDDEADVRRWLADHLSAAGYEVVAAVSGAAALAQLARQSVEVMILDLRMPGEDGVDVLRRARQSVPHLEVVVSTGYADVGTVIECLRAGAGDVVPKPCAGAEVAAAVARALERRRLHVADALHQASQAIFASSIDARLPQRIVNAAQHVLAADEVSLLVLEGDGRLHLANASGRAAASADDPPLELGERIAGRVLLQRTPVIINGPVEQDPRFRGLCGDQRIRSSIVYPLLAGERPVGVLNLCRVSNPHAFRETDLELVAVLASQILLALENGRLARQMVGAERLASIGLVAAGVAHEINNPLAYALANLAFVEQQLGGLAELARLLDGAAAPEAVRACWRGLGGGELVDGLKDAVRDSGEGMGRIRDITRDLRSLARVDTDSSGGVADLNDAVRSAVRVASAEIRSRATVIERLGGDVLVRGSPARLSQVLINLLVNAGQALADAPDGRREIVVTTRREGDRVVAQVADTGPGIGPEHLPRLFDLFFTTKPAGVGTGLGLSISRDIVRHLGGDIRVASILGSGTTFTVVLPAAATAAAAPAAAETAVAAAVAPAPAPARAPAGTRGPRCRILIVDDEAGMLRSLERLLARDHDVVLAQSGEQALAALAGSPDFDLVLSDLLMPGMSGVELYQRAASAGTQVAEAFVFMTGSSGFRELQDVLLATGRRVLRKPLDLAALKDIIVTWARRRRGAG